MASEAGHDGPARSSQRGVTGLVLAGGAGRRLGGAAKGLTLFRGESLLQRVLHVLREGCDALCISTPPGGLVLPDEPDCRIIEDRVAAQGPLSAFAAAAGAFGNDAPAMLLTAPWDCPFLPLDLAPRLIAASRVADTSIIAADAERAHPAIGCWRWVDVLAIAALFESGERRFHAAAKAVGAGQLLFGTADPPLFFNLNTPEDLAMLGRLEARALPETLDCTNLKCPLPVLRTRKRLAAMPPGERLVVIATDAMAAIDIPHLCHEEGHRLIGVEKGDVLRFEIEKAPTPER